MGRLMPQHMTCNLWEVRPSFGSIPVRHREVARALVVEGLEQRSLLTGPAFGIIYGAFPASGARASVTNDVSTQDFTLDRSGRVDLELVATANGGAPLTIGTPVGALRRTLVRSLRLARDGGLAHWRRGNSRFRSAEAPRGPRMRSMSRWSATPKIPARSTLATSALSDPDSA
jgi:hypothetical protein